MRESHWLRRRIASGGLTLEAIPESKRVGIPIEQLYDGWWLPLHVARQLVHGERQELAVLKRKSR